MALPLDYRQRLQQILGGDADPLRDAVLGRLRTQESADPQAASMLDPNRLVQPPLNGAWVNGQWVPLGDETEPLPSTQLDPSGLIGQASIGQSPQAQIPSDVVEQPAPEAPPSSMLDMSRLDLSRLALSPETNARMQTAFDEAGQKLATQRQQLSEMIPAPVRSGLTAAKDYIGSLFEPDPQVKAVGDILHQGIESAYPRTGNRLIDAMVAPHRALPNVMTEQVISSTTPGGAALNLDLPAPAMAAVVGQGGKAAARLRAAVAARLAAGKTALADVSPVFAEIKALFPRLDAYTKRTGLISGATILKRLEATPQLSQEAKTALTQLAEEVGGRRISADELHALAQGKEYTPERVLRKVKEVAEGAKQRPGAPLGVTTARHEAALRDKYLQLLEQGIEGRRWYEDAGQSIMFHASDNPVRAQQLADDLAITSPSTGVEPNTGFGVKGYNQATAGVPIEAGRFPTAMGKNIEAAHATGSAELGLKRTPFSDNMARGGGFLSRTGPTRPVNDIWQGEAFGFVNPDGTPMRQGFTAAQHRWMDEQTDKIIAEANRRKLGGFDDWDPARVQAAAWVGAKVRAGQMNVADAGRSYADFFKNLYAQGSRETVPGMTTGHMPELLVPSATSARQALHDLVRQRSGIYDPQMRDRITAGYGGLTGASFEGPGLYEGVAAPGIQTQVLSGSYELKGGPTGARALDEGSRRILNAAEASHGLLLVQDMSAWSRILPAGSGAARTGWEVALPGGKITAPQLEALTRLLDPAIVKNAVFVPTPNGIRLGLMPEATAKQAVKALNGKVTLAGKFEGNALSNDWRIHRVGQEYFDPIRLIGTEKFDKTAPPIAQALREIDRDLATSTGGKFTLSPVVDELRGTIANEGWAGLERLAKKYAIPVVLLTAALERLKAANQPGTARGSA